MIAMVCGKGWDKNKIKQAADAYNIDELMNLLLLKRVLFDVLMLVPFDQKGKSSRIQQPTLNFKQQKITCPLRCGYAENLQLIVVGHTNHQEKPPHI